MDSKELESLQKSVDELRETLSAKVSGDAQKKEADELFNRVMDKINPPARKMTWAINSKDPSDKKVCLAQYLKAVTPGKEQSVSEDVRAHIKATMVEGTDSLGGYTVPEEYSHEIIKLEKDNSIIRQIAKIFPMATDVRNLPRQLTDVTVTWTGEGAAKTETNPTFDRLVQTAKKLAAIVKMTDELLEDNTAGLDQFIMGLVAEAMGREEDRVALAGNTGAGDPFMGVLYASGVNSVAMAGANVVGDDIIDLIMSLNAKYRTGATLVTSTAGLKLLMKLKDQEDRYLWAPPTATTPASIWGVPYLISDELPLDLGTGNDETPILFGNYKKHFFVSDRGGYEVKSSISASDIGNSQSAFMEDETWFRFKKRMSLDVALPQAFSKLSIK
jgi:HK97 family phage major capsid protein